MYIVDSGVLGSHDDFGGRVVNGHTVRAASVARVQSSECPHTPPPPVTSYSTMRLSTAPHHLTTLNTLTPQTTPSPLPAHHPLPSRPLPSAFAPLAGSRSHRVRFVPSCQRHPPRRRFWVQRSRHPRGLDRRRPKTRRRQGSDDCAGVQLLQVLLPIQWEIWVWKE